MLLTFLMLIIFYTCFFQQWPIGGGKLGALVGGSFSTEVVPVSVPDFFSTNTMLEAQAMNRDDSPSTWNKTHQAVAEVREILKNKRMTVKERMIMVTGKAEQIQRGNSGSFEYIADLVFVFTMLPIGHSTKKVFDEIYQCDDESGIMRYKLPRKPKVFFPREDIVCNIYCGLRKILASEGPLTRSKKSLIIEKMISSHSKTRRQKNFQISHLDTKRRYVSGTYVRGEEVHYRDWGIIYPNNNGSSVLVGKFRCTMFGKEVDRVGNSQGCLKVAMQMNRLGEVGAFSKITNSSTVRINNGSGLTIIHKVGLILGPSDYTIVPHAFTCVAFVCSSSTKTVESYGKDHDHNGTIFCNNANVAKIYVAVEKQDNIAIQDSLKQQLSKKKRKPSLYSKLEAEKIEMDCWNRLNAVVESDTSPVLDDDKALLVNHNDVLVKHKGILGMHKSQSTKNSLDVVDFNLHVNPTSENSPSDSNISLLSSIAPMYNMGKYLLQSAGGNGNDGHVMNLQGLWSEGKTSEWNGDYHLNINLQMSYWPSDSIGVSEQVLPGLIQFLSALRKSGRKAAAQIYNCNDGWVAHGFTDGYMGAGLNGGLKWSYCVTCGAWASLALWDHISHASLERQKKGKHTQLAILEMFSSFKGIAEFMFCYLHKIGNTYHSGPTGSPENSYRGVSSNGKIIASYFASLAFSPSIDISILRNVADAYNLALDWGLAPSLTEEGEHYVIAKKFKNMVYSMPGEAKPSIHYKSGLILEYIDPFGNGGSPNKMSHDESFDMGHRHWSSLHWLYPGTSAFNAEKQQSQTGLSSQLAVATNKTLDAKRWSSAGHTSWSSAWEASLMARMARGEDAENALVRIISSQSTPRLMSLHPALSRSTYAHTGCETCYNYPQIYRKTISKEYGPLTGLYPTERSTASFARRFATRDFAVFQIDGNLGFVAAVNEMLLQTHIRNHVSILPALPESWRKAGGEFLIITFYACPSCACQTSSFLFPHF